MNLIIPLRDNGGVSSFYHTKNWSIAFCVIVFQRLLNRDKLPHQFRVRVSSRKFRDSVPVGVRRFGIASIAVRHRRIGIQWLSSTTAQCLYPKVKTQGRWRRFYVGIVKRKRKV